MLIVLLEPLHLTRGGDWYYRTYSPGRALAQEDGVSVIQLSASHPSRDAWITRADVVVLNMLCDPDLFPLIAERKNARKPTVFEVNDDISALSSHSPTAAFYQDGDNQLLFRMLVGASTAVQFSSAELQRRYQRYAPHSALFKNQLSLESLPPAPRAPKTGPLVIGWGGSAGHYDDLVAIAGPLIEWLRSRNDVVLHLMSNDAIAELFSSLPVDQLRRFPTGDIGDYHRFVGGLDIGIAPLLRSDFNDCRSDVKFLEYAWHGVVPVLSNAPAYRESIVPRETGFFFDSPDELVATLEELAQSPGLRAAVATAAQRHVIEHRAERAHAIKRVEFYRQLIPNGRVEASDVAAVEAEALRDSATREGRHWTLGPTVYERLLYNALVAGQQMRRREEALRLLEQAAALEPKAYLPHLFSAPYSTEPIACLERAIAKNPRSIKAWLLLADQQFRASSVEAAVASLMKAAELYPAYDIPYVRLARFMSELGNAGEADCFARLAAELRGPFRPQASQ